MGVPGAPPGLVDQWLGVVQAGNRAFLPDQGGHGEGVVTRAAADIENELAGLRIEQRQGRLAERGHEGGA